MEVDDIGAGSVASIDDAIQSREMQVDDGLPAVQPHPQIPPHDVWTSASYCGSLPSPLLSPLSPEYEINLVDGICDEWERLIEESEQYHEIAFYMLHDNYSHRLYELVFHNHVLTHDMRASGPLEWHGGPLPAGAPELFGQWFVDFIFD